MRIAILAVGTRGDIVPVTVLAERLRAAGHETVVATSEEHSTFVLARGLAHAPLGPSYARSIEAGEAVLGKSRRGGVALLRDGMRDAARDWAREGRAATDGAGLIIGLATSMGAVADALGEAGGIPVVHAHLMPLVPSRHVPPPLPPPPRRALPGPVNLALFRAMRAIVWRACFADAIGRLRADLGLPAASRWPRDPAAKVLCAWSPSLLAAPPDWPAASIRVTGAWRSRAAPEFAPPEALARFVADGPAPVHVGFGSMRLAAEARLRLRDAVAAGLARAGRRGIVGGGLLDGLADGSPGLIAAGTAPYAWLFERVGLAIHHGGSGGVHDAAAAGVPQLVVPFVVDQFLWGRALAQAGVAPWRLDRTRLSADRLARAIDRAEAPAMRARARALAGRIAAEDGPGEAIAALQAWRLLG